MAWFLHAFIWTLFPLSGFLLFILVLPQWPIVRRGSLWLTEKILFAKVPILGGNLSLYTSMLFLAGLTFAGSVWEVQRAQADYVLNKKFGRTDELSLVKKFRAERNFWIALFALVLWLLILRVRQMQLDISGLESAVEISSKLVRANREGQGQGQGWFPNPIGSPNTTASSSTSVSAGGKSATIATGIQTVPSAPAASPPGPKFAPATSTASTSTHSEREDGSPRNAVHAAEAKKDK